MNSAYPSKIDQETHLINVKSVTSEFLDKNIQKLENAKILDEKRRNIHSNDLINYDVFNKDRANLKDNNKTTTFENIDMKDIFQSTKHAKFRKNKEKDSSKLKLNEKDNGSVSKQPHEQNIEKNIIHFDSVLSFKTLNFVNNHDKFVNKSNNRTNLNQDNSIVKTKKKREKENKKENNLNNQNLNFTNYLSSITTNKISSNNFDSISLNSDPPNNTINNIITLEKTPRDKENNLFNQKGNRKSNKNINPLNTISSNFQSLNSNSTNNDTFKFSFRPTISDFINNDSSHTKTNIGDEQEDDLFKILQKNVKEANDVKPTIGEKKKRFYENYLI